MPVSDSVKELWAKVTEVAGSAATKSKEVAGAAVEKTQEVAAKVDDKLEVRAAKNGIIGSAAGLGHKVVDRVDGDETP